MALAVMLAIAAALLIRTFVALRAVPPGFDPHQVLTLRLSLSGSRFERTSAVNLLVRQATSRMEALAGVTRAAATLSLPLEGYFGIPFNIAGRPSSNGRYDGRGWLAVSPGYFAVLS
jgi:hypothetical protein